MIQLCYVIERPRIGEVRTTSRGSAGVTQVFHDISGNRTWNQICSSTNDNDAAVANTFCTQLLGYSGTTATYTTVLVNTILYSRKISNGFKFRVSQKKM